MQSSYHNLPDINGQPQPHMIQWRSDFFETSDSPQEAVITIGLASAYPESANLESYVRTLRFDRDRKAITLNEQLAFRDGNAASAGNSITFHFMTHHVPAPGNKKGEVLRVHPATGQTRAILACPPGLEISVNKILLEDPRMAASWGDTLYRIVVQAQLEPGEHMADYVFKIARAD